MQIAVTAVLSHQDACAPTNRSRRVDLRLNVNHYYRLKKKQINGKKHAT